jgi:hypothetical protein
MQSLPQVTLVDALTGRPITPDDRGDAAAWPASNDVDGWHWEPGSAEDDAPTAAERADFESWLEQTDAAGPPADEVDDFEPDFPRRRQVSPIELSMLAAHGAI